MLSTSERGNQTLQPTLGILASGNGSNFLALANAITNNVLDATIGCVIYNNADARIALHAAQQHIPAYYIDHRHYGVRHSFDLAIVEKLRQHHVQWIIMAGWMRIATKALLTAFPDRILNIHPSLLPLYPGLNAIEKSLANNDKFAGCTVHIVNEIIDGGPIISQAKVPIYPEDTPTTLRDRIQQEEHIIYPRAVQKFIHQPRSSD